MATTTPPPISSFNARVIDDFRANGGQASSGPFVGRALLLLTAIGGKSGASYTTPLVYSRDGDRYVIVASKGGAPTNPAWYHNLVANPEVTVEVGTETFRARASEVSGPERDRLYAQHAVGFPGFLDYQKKTERVIPVFVLERLP
jgi:deazaflavin-dependent oxidoreductase (nitroreductase family)